MSKTFHILEEDACAFLLYKVSNQKLNRDTLRSILKKNKCSYHKPGPKNHMKTVHEMEMLINNASLYKLTKLIENNLIKYNILL